MQDHLLVELCKEILSNHIGSERFNDLLLQTGVMLTDWEWYAASRMLSESEVMHHFLDPIYCTMN